MPSAGFLIYSGIMPLIKTYIMIICGYVVAKMNLFPAKASRGASHIAMNVALPGLIFANVVPAFTPSNVAALGPLFSIAFVYMGLGLLAGVIIREICYIPRNFWQCIIVLTAMSNWGNLPTAIVLTITEQAPFNPDIDPALGVSYVSIFIVSFHTVFWMFGAAHSLSWDYRPGVPQGEAAERRISWKAKPLGSLIARYILRQDIPDAYALPMEEARKVHDEEALSENAPRKQEGDVGVADSAVVDLSDPAAHASPPNPDVQLARRTSGLSTVASGPYELPTAVVSRTLSPAPMSLIGASREVLGDNDNNEDDDGQRSATLNQETLRQRAVRVFKPLSALISPVTITLAVSLPIALVQPLKALFVDVSDAGGPDWKGPDGKPPLAFVTDSASFVGNVTVPLTLLLLGASFARMNVPRPLSRLPLMAMFLSTAWKTIVLPVIGVFLVNAMTAGGLVGKDEKVLRFVMMFLSGTPTSVNQLIVASLYSPDGKADTLAAFLLVQYVFMFISSSALTAVALLLI